MHSSQPTARAAARLAHHAAPSRLDRLAHSHAAFWAAFVLVHGALTALALGPLVDRTFYDVQLYRYWIEFGFNTGAWPVFDMPWVYPVLALVPMLLAWFASFGTMSGYLLAWCLMVTGLNAIAAGIVLRRVPRHAMPAPTDLDVDEFNQEQLEAPRRSLAPGWFFLAFLLCLGTVSIGRIDAIAAPLATIALCYSLRRPTLAAAIATIGAWIKIFPGAVFLMLALVSRRARGWVIAAGAAITAGIAAVVVAGGGAQYLFGFLTDQSSRGLQLESTLGTPLVVGRAIAGLPVSYYDAEINTFEIPGHLSGQIALLGNLLLVIIVVVTSLLVWLARRHPYEVIPMGAFALSVALIVGNKVGSPQFFCALVPAVMVALIRPHPQRHWRQMAVLVLVLGALTQAIFPWSYDQLQAGAPWAVALLAARNFGVVVLMAWTLWRLVVLARLRPGPHGPASEREERGVPDTADGAPGGSADPEPHAA